MQPFSVGDKMKSSIKAYANKLNIEYMGIVSAEPQRELQKWISVRREKYGVTPFEEQDIRLRTDPGKTLPGAKSVIVCLFPYYHDGNGAENISMYARIPDYHRVVMAYLERICEFIQGIKPNCTLIPYVDNGPLADKYLAYRAGLGFYGKNTLFINPKYGSYCFIGYIITDIALEPDKPMEETCRNCGACMKACPGNAIGEEHDFCAEKCVSYITQAKEITDEQKRILSKQTYVYGCDICQNVCPFNQNISKTPISEFMVPTLASFEEKEIAGMSNREFKHRFSTYPFSWRSKEAILKNFTK